MSDFSFRNIHYIWPVLVPQWPILKSRFLIQKRTALINRVTINTTVDFVQEYSLWCLPLQSNIFSFTITSRLVRAGKSNKGREWAFMSKSSQFGAYMLLGSGSELYNLVESGFNEFKCGPWTPLIRHFFPSLPPPPQWPARLLLRSFVSARSSALRRSGEVLIQLRLLGEIRGKSDHTSTPERCK